jgi:hypothetical protein
MAEKDKVYKCLNPVGIHDPVEQFPLAPRLTSLDGKNIHFTSRAGSEQDILIPLKKMLPVAYPKVNWHISEAAHHGKSSQLSEEELKTADAVIRGVLW